MEDQVLYDFINSYQKKYQVCEGGSFFNYSGYVAGCHHQITPDIRPHLGDELVRLDPTRE